MRRITTCSVALITMALSVSAASAEDHYSSAQLADLEIKNGSLPSWDIKAQPKWYRFVNSTPVTAYAVLDGIGEAYLAPVTSRSIRSGAGSLKIVTRNNKKGSVSGTLYLLNQELSGMRKLSFKMPADAATGDAAATEFRTIKKAHYKRLLSRRLPGSAWFRHQLSTVGNKVSATAPRRPRRNEMAQTYALFTGGRAVSENLQLDRELWVRPSEDKPVDISTLTGITVREMDWTRYIEGKTPKLDAMANLIPFDQYALFFPSFQAVVDAIDESMANGVPVLRLVEPRSEDARTRERYEKQLCVSMTALARVLGPQLISSVAVTGSDPYLRTGSDVAVLIATRKPDTVLALWKVELNLAIAAIPGAAKASGDIEGLKYTGAVSGDRRLASYAVATKDRVIIANSLHQMSRVLLTLKGKKSSIVRTPEYTYFRSRYPLGDDGETAFLLLTDTAIRKWCSPKWRIASSRRTRAAAVMAELQARYVADLAVGKVKGGAIEHEFESIDLGEVSVSARGIVRSSIYNTLAFLTPIAELGITEVTSAEALGYQRWRDGYQRNWSRYFDPIAMRFAVSKTSVGADITVMPLIAGSDYNDIIEVTKGGRIKAGAGDPHDEALLHVIMAIDPSSKLVKQLGNLLGGTEVTPIFGPFDWLGGAVSVYADKDPFWQELAKAEDEQQFLEREFYRLPIAANVGIRNSLAFAGFLVTIRALADQTVPGMMVWESLKYKDQAYVKVTPRAEEGAGEEDAWQKMSIFYAPTPRSVVITLSEPLLKRALDRQAARREAVKAGEKIAAREPWLGKHLALQVGKGAFDIADKLLTGKFHEVMQFRAWGNIPILNELARMFPKKNSGELYEKFWGTRLVCPGGGSYVWNKEWHTFESTAYGHPGVPKDGPSKPPALLGYQRGNLGITFEEEGLRARAKLERAQK